MQQIHSRETGKWSASQNIPCILHSLKVLCCAHKSKLPVHILSQINPLHMPTSMPLSSISPFILGFHTKSMPASLLAPMYATCTPSLALWLAQINNITTTGSHNKDHDLSLKYDIFWLPVYVQDKRYNDRNQQWKSEYLEKWHCVIGREEVTLCHRVRGSWHFKGTAVFKTLFCRLFHAILPVTVLQVAL